MKLMPNVAFGDQTPVPKTWTTLAWMVKGLEPPDLTIGIDILHPLNQDFASACY